MPEIIIKRSRMVVVLQEQEVLDMLKQHPETWAQGLKRGKHFARAIKEQNRRTGNKTGGRDSPVLRL